MLLTTFKAIEIQASFLEKFERMNLKIQPLKQFTQETKIHDLNRQKGMDINKCA